MVWTLLEEADRLRHLQEDLRLEVTREPSPTGLRVYGSVRAVLAGTVPEEVLVDEWPKWGVIVVRPPSKQEQPDHLLRTVSIHCRSAVSHGLAVPIHDAIDWTKSCTFACLPLQTVTTLAGLAGDHGSMVRLIDCDTLVHRNEALLERPIPVPEPYMATTVLPSMSATVVSHWRQNVSNQTTFGDAAAVKLVEFNCTNFPSSCITEASGKPVAHVLCHYYGAVGMLGLSRDHKGHGLAALVLHDLCRKLREDAQPLWAHIEKGNMAAAELFVRTGFTPLRGAATAWLEYTPHLRTSSTAQMELGGATSALMTSDSPNEMLSLDTDYF